MLIKSEWFHNQASYEGFMLGVEIVNKIKTAQSIKALIFDSEGLLKGEWVVEASEDGCMIGLRDGNFTLGYVGSCWDMKSGKTYCTKKEVKDAFKDVSYVLPVSVNKFI